MTELLLSSQRLENCNVLQTDQLDVFEALKKQGALDIISMEADVPKGALTLEWKEVQTPKTPTSFRDLSGKKLTEYKFQYLGQFSYKDKVVEVDEERFVANFPDQNISDTNIQSTGWLNCTWLIDFLVNGTKIQEDTFRKERLIWRKDKKEFVFSLSRETLDKRSAEQEQFVFADKFETVAWEHRILFSGQSSC